MAPKLPYYIVISEFKNFIFLQPTNEPRWAEVMRKEKAGELEMKAGMSRPRAAAHMTEDMIVDHVFDEESGKSRKVFRDQVVLCQTDSKGRIFIDKDKTELARYCLKILRNLDKTTHLDPEGYLLPEETPNGPRAAINVGGRGKKTER